MCHYFPWSITNGASLPIYEWGIKQLEFDIGKYHV